MKNTISDLRNHLFATLEGLTNLDSADDQPRNAEEVAAAQAKQDRAIQRAQAVVKVSAEIIKAAKVQVEFINATGQDDGSAEFFDIRCRGWPEG